MASAMAAAKATAENNTVHGETMPIISGSMQAAASEMIKKYLGDGSLIIDDPIKANEEEQQLATFAQLMKLKGGVGDIIRWRAAFIFAFVKSHPETAALAIIELRNALRDLIADGDKTVKELVGTEKPIVAAPTPAPIAATAGPKKSRYS